MKTLPSSSCQCQLWVSHQNRDSGISASSESASFLSSLQSLQPGGLCFHSPLPSVHRLYIGSLCVCLTLQHHHHGENKTDLHQQHFPSSLRLISFPFLFPGCFFSPFAFPLPVVLKGIFRNHRMQTWMSISLCTCNTIDLISLLFRILQISAPAESFVKVKLQVQACVG